MFEGPLRPPLSRRRFAVRMAVFVLAAIIADGIAVAVGAVGFHFTEGLGWLDACLNAALVMTGNGPSHPPLTRAGKIFTIFDALFGVILFGAVIGALLVPIFHRTLHVFQSQSREKREREEQSSASDLIRV